MSVEIRELIIRAEVSQTDSTAHPKDDLLQNPNGQDFRRQNHIIEACVKQVLAILRKQKER